MNHPTSKVGATRSGRDIVMYLTDDEEFTIQGLAELTLAEHFDAWAVFQRLAIRAKRKCGEGGVEFERYGVLGLHGQFVASRAEQPMIRPAHVRTVGHASVLSYLPRPGDKAPPGR